MNNTSSNSASRRGFLKGAAALGAAALTARSYGRVVGANDRIRLGQIGCGQRGYEAHMTGGIHPHDKAQNVEYVAVCDVWTVHRERAAKTVKDWYGHEAKQTSAYKELLDWKDVDAVMIATCDHQHTTHLKAAVGAGKDVYCEKPLAMDMESLKSAVDAVKATDRVVQIGTQLRSMPSYRGCREVYQTGVLGTVSRVEQCRNAGTPYWYRRMSRQVEEKDVDWGNFLCGKPARPFSAELFAGWFGYRGFSDGPIPQLGVHFIDAIHYITGASIPTSAVCNGGIFTFKDEHKFTTPDSIQGTWVYPEGFVLSYETNFGNAGGNCSRIYGQSGLMDFSKPSDAFVTGAGAGKKGKLGSGQEKVTPVEGPDHFLDWLQCLRTRKMPNAPIDAGYAHAVAAIMALMAFDSGKRMVYDAGKREVREG